MIYTAPNICDHGTRIWVQRAPNKRDYTNFYNHSKKNRRKY